MNGQSFLRRPGPTKGCWASDDDDDDDDDDDIAHPVQWLFILFFPLYILISQIFSSCKVSLTKVCECISHFLVENHMSCPIFLAYIPLSLRKRDQITKLV